MSKIQVTNINDLSDNASLITQSGGIKSDKLTGVTTAGSILVTGEGNSTTTNLQQGLCKAWINFNGQNTPAARDSFNISSLTDNGTGVYAPNFSSVMSNANYGTTCGPHGGDAGSVNYAIGIASTTTSLVNLRNQNANGGQEDNTQNNAAVHGDLA